jgi:hypothetical protein
MKTLKPALGILGFTLALGAAVTAAHAQYGPPPPPPPGSYYQGGPGGPGGDWERVPPEFREVQQRGFHDGVEGAKRDFKNHRPPNVYNRDEFRNPHFIAPPDRRDYKIGFQRGYDVAARHIWGPNPYPYGYRPY